MIDGFTANIIGLLGRAVNAFVYNGTNLAGALLLTVSLMVHFNLASLLLEFVWIIIAVGGLIKARRDQKGLEP